MDKFLRSEIYNRFPSNHLGVLLRFLDFLAHSVLRFGKVSALFLHRPLELHSLNLGIILNANIAGLLTVSQLLLFPVWGREGFIELPVRKKLLVSMFLQDSHTCMVSM